MDLIVSYFARNMNIVDLPGFDRFIFRPIYEQGGFALFIFRPKYEQGGFARFIFRPKYEQGGAVWICPVHISPEI